MTASTPWFGQDPAVGRWLTSRMRRDEWGLVTGFLPAGYAAYARLFHSAAEAGTADRPGEARRWAEVAERVGSRMHPLAQWYRLVGLRDPFDAHRSGGLWPGEAPAQGTLTDIEVAALVPHLEAHTRTPDSCWFGLWEGHGWVGGSPAIGVLGSDAVVRSPFSAEARSRTLDVSGRNHLIGHGPVRSARAMVERTAADWWMAQSPNLMWPDDQAWCVLTEIDFNSTLIGGGRSLIDALTAEPDLEVHEVLPGDRVDAGSDLLN